MELTLRNLVVVKVIWSASLFSFIYKQKHSKKFGSKILVTDRLCRKGKSVSQKLIRVVWNFNCLRDYIDTTTRYSNTDNLFIVSFAEALVELLIYNCFHSWVDFNLVVFVINNFNTLLNVKVDTFVYKCLCVRILVPDVKSVSWF